LNPEFSRIKTLNFGKIQANFISGNPFSTANENFKQKFGFIVENHFSNQFPIDRFP